MNYTPPVEIAAFLACLFFVAALFNQLARLWYSLRGKPTPAEMASASATLSERIGRIETCMGACQADHGRRLESLEAHQSAVRTLISQEVGVVHEKVNAVATLVGTVTGTLESIQNNLNLLISRSLRP